MANEIAIVQDFKKGVSFRRIMVTHHLTKEQLQKKLAYFKGEKNGLCNRRCCMTPKDVVFFNKGTSKYYCDDCAFKINQACMNDDLERLFGKGTIYLCLTDEGDEPRVFWDKKIRGELGEEDEEEIINQTFKREVHNQVRKVKHYE